MVLDLFIIGLVASLEPIPLTAIILLLAAERGVVKGVGFVLGWLFSVVAIVILVVAITGGEPLIPQSSPSTAALAVKLAIGVLLVAIAYRRRDRWHARLDAEAASKKQPRWMTGIDRVNPVAAAGLAFLVQPWVVIAAGATTIFEAKLTDAAEYVVLVLFVLWCTASYLALEIYAVVRPEKVKTKLAALLEWINTHRDQAIVVLSLVLGLYLMAKSIYGLVNYS